MNQLITPVAPVEVLDPVPLPDLWALRRIEAAKFSRLWTIVNELRLHKQLPEWVLKSFPEAGTRFDHTEHRAASEEVDRAILQITGPEPRVSYRSEVH